MYGSGLRPWNETALEKAVTARNPPPGLVHHSDRGVQYASDEYMGVLKEHRIVPGMSRPANPYDNASGGWLGDRRGINVKRYTTGVIPPGRAKVLAVQACPDKKRPGVPPGLSQLLG